MAVGAVTVTKIVELEVTGGGRFILPQATPEAIMPIGWLQPDFADERGRLILETFARVGRGAAESCHEVRSGDCGWL